VNDRSGAIAARAVSATANRSKRKLRSKGADGGSPSSQRLADSHLSTMCHNPDISAPRYCPRTWCEGTAVFNDHPMDARFEWLPQPKMLQTFRVGIVLTSTSDVQEELPVNWQERLFMSRE
jgi:hypothetical protein